MAPQPLHLGAFKLTAEVALTFALEPELVEVTLRALRGDFLSLFSGTRISMPDTASAAVVSVTAFITFLLQHTHPGMGWAVKERTEGPPAEPGRTRRTGTIEEVSAKARCAPARRA